MVDLVDYRNWSFVDEICSASIFYQDGRTICSSRFNLRGKSARYQLKTVTQNVVYFIASWFVAIRVHNFR